MNALVPRWLEMADSDLAAAEHLLRAAFPHGWIPAFHAQQAVEKYLKAYLVARGDAEFPYTHSIRQLRLRIGTLDPELADSISSADPLTPYATTARYPERELEPGARTGDITADEARHALAVAVEVRTRIMQRVAPYLT